VRAVVLSLTDPWAASHGGTIRTRALTTALADLGHDVTTVFATSEPERGTHEPRSTASGAPVPDGVSVLPVHSPTVGNRAWPAWVKNVKRTLLPLPTTMGGRSAGLASALRELAPVHLLVVSVLPFAQYLDQLPGARLWVDHSDLYSDVVSREASRRTGLARLTAGVQHRGVLRSENRLAASAAVTTAAGFSDAEQLAARTGADVDWLPTPVATAEVPRDASARPVAGFFANFHYWPNRDALELLETVWAPRLMAMGWDVLVAGLGSDRIEPTPHVTVLGPVPRPEDFYRRVDVTLAPVRVGGGMKVKVVESLTHGRPVVATPFALAGFPVGLARTVEVVEPEAPVFSMLRDGPPSVSSATLEHLTPFTSDGFRMAVDALVRRSGLTAEAADAAR
jgi:polysaccharide biosynthesis protein PslH